MGLEFDTPPPPPTITVGWREFVALPEWGIRRIRAKIDTGARTSALHVDNIEPLPGDRVRFHVILHRHHPHRRVQVEADRVRIARVKPSSGRVQERCVVATRVRLGPVEQVIELGLVCRQQMLCRMLVGRTALEGRFIVDPSARYLLGRPVRRRKRREPPT